MNRLFLFLKSSLESEGNYISTEKLLGWVATQNKQVKVKVERTRFDELKNWSFSEGRFRHASGKYFSIDGVRVQTNWSRINEWDQPIINQPEVGYLGFIAKEINGVLHFLAQAKVEPGNVNYVQISPTLQATRSNYTQVHKGKVPLYLEYFKNARPEQILLDQLQSEQGARFLRKRNRNIIILVTEEIPVYDNFVWLTLGQIKHLIQFDNLVNMDTRTVLSGITYGNYGSGVVDIFAFIRADSEKTSIQSAMLKSAMSQSPAVNSVDRIITFLTALKSEYDLNVTRVPLGDLSSWIVEDDKIYHEGHKYFSVIAVNVEISNREVSTWSQPMVEPAQDGLCAFVCKEIDGLLHFAVQAKLECGNHDIIEFAPTVQCLTGNYRETKESALPFLDYVLNAKPEQKIYDALQSEEGGRFYREQNRNLIVMAGDDIPITLPERYIWMTLSQMYTFLKFNNYLNIQARSLIAAISFT
jgi:dTDP-4-dehydro-6-deoxy-alpha-D-glucopyranose 2,3-dehydratase